MDDASNAVSTIIGEGIIPAALEMMDTLVIRALEEAFQFGFPLDAEAILIVELDGIEAGMQNQTDQILEIFKQHNAREVDYAEDEAERQQLWKARKKCIRFIWTACPELYHPRWGRTTDDAAEGATADLRNL